MVTDTIKPELDETHKGLQDPEFKIKGEVVQFTSQQLNETARDIIKSGSEAEKQEFMESFPPEKINEALIANMVDPEGQMDSAKADEVIEVFPHMMGVFTNSPAIKGFLTQYIAEERKMYESEADGFSGDGIESMMGFVTAMEEELKEIENPEERGFLENFLAEIVDHNQLKEKLKKEMVITAASGGAEIFPGVMSARMLLDASRGKDLTDHELSEWETAGKVSGALALGAIDYLAAPATIVGKAAHTALVMKRMAKMAAVLERVAKLQKTSRGLFATGEFLAKHPQIVPGLAKLYKSNRGLLSGERVKELAHQAKESKEKIEQLPKIA